jgi:hypothetical protein
VNFWKFFSQLHLNYVPFKISFLLI